MNVLTQDLVSTESIKQRSLKKIQLKQQDKYDIFSVMSSCEIIQNVVDIDGFIKVAIQTSDNYNKEYQKNGIDILLNFVSNFFSALSSSVDELMNTSRGSYSIGSILFLQHAFRWDYINNHK